jgi:hypothetical protein
MVGTTASVDVFSCWTKGIAVLERTKAAAQSLVAIAVCGRLALDQCSPPKPDVGEVARWGNQSAKRRRQERPTAKIEVARSKAALDNDMLKVMVSESTVR